MPTHVSLERFTDRNRPIEDFRVRIRWEPGLSARHVIYHGEGGMGKTAFQHFVTQRICASQEVKVPYAIVNFEEPHDRGPVPACQTIRRQLGQANIPFVIFDTVWARYLEETLGKRFNLNEAPAWMARMGYAAEIVSFLASVSAPVGIITSVAGWLYQKRAERSGNKWDWFRRKWGEEWRSRLQNMRVGDLIEILPEALTSDIEAAMQEPKNRGVDGKWRITIFFDGYEWLEQTDFQDTFVIELCRELRSALIVICGRNSIRAPGTALDHFPPFENFSLQEANEYLHKRGITVPILCAHLVRVTEGFPYYLALAADWCEKFKAQNQVEPDVADLGDIELGFLEDALVKRLLREIPHGDRHAVLLAAIPRWFDQRILSLLLAEPAQAPYLFGMVTRFSFCEQYAEHSGVFVIRPTTRRLLYMEARELPQWQKWNLRLSKYHAECTSAMNDETLRFRHRLESVYHALVVDGSTGWSLFVTAFETAKARHHIARCRALLDTAYDAIPEDRRVDFYEAEVFLLEGRIPEAAEKLESLLRERLDELEMHAKILNCFGEVCLGQGIYEDALKAFDDSLAIYAELDTPHEAWLVLNNRGKVYAVRGEWENAVKAYSESLELCRRTSSRDIKGEVAALNSLGDALLEQAQEEEYERIPRQLRKAQGRDAWHTFQEALQIATQEGLRDGQALTLHNMARFCLAWPGKRQSERALEYFQQSLVYSWSLGDLYRVAEVLLALVLVWRIKDQQRARKCAETAQQLFAGLGDRRGEEEARGALQALGFSFSGSDVDE